MVQKAGVNACRPPLAIEDDFWEIVVWNLGVQRAT
jgi:hypothetical protein